MRALQRMAEGAAERGYQAAARQSDSSDDVEDSEYDSSGSPRKRRDTRHTAYIQENPLPPSMLSRIASFGKLGVRAVMYADRLMYVLLYGVAFGVGALALAILFELVYPFEADADVVFSNATFAMAVTQQYIDLFVGAGNTGLGMVRPLIPLWNSIASYVVQPAVFVLVETLSTLVFFEQADPSHELFFMTGEPFYGYDCSASDVTLETTDDEKGRSSQAWCGLYGYYVDGITAMEQAAASADAENDSGLSRARRLRTEAANRFAVPRRMARRISERTGIPAFPTQVIDSFAHVSGFIVGSVIMLLGSVSDTLFHLLYVVLDEMATAIGGLIIELLHTLFELVYQLVTSGFFEKILGMALDVIVILAIDIALPMMMATIDALQCIFHLFDPNSFGEEMRCVNEKCFAPGTDIAADLMVFSSAVIVMDEIYTVVQDTFNAGRRMFGLAGQVNLDSGWLTRTNSWYNNATVGCASCFKCKVGAAACCLSTSTPCSLLPAPLSQIIS